MRPMISDFSVNVPPLFVTQRDGTQLSLAAGDGVMGGEQSCMAALQATVEEGLVAN